MGRFRTRLCTDPGCGLRFPVETGSPLGATCPVCGAPTRFVDEPYDTHDARTVERPPVPTIEALFDNVRSLRNVGSMFRTADAALVSHLHLAGITGTPEHPRLAKTALGAERMVPWTRYRDGVRAARELVAAGRTLWALEGGASARSLYAVPAPAADTPLVLVCGHEVSGIDPRILELCAVTVKIPMLGHKGSLNVSVAFGIAVYHLRFGCDWARPSDPRLE